MSKGGITVAKFLKNISYSQVLSLAELTDYMPGQVVSKTIAQNSEHSLTLFAFDKGEEISTHASGGDAIVIALDGQGEIVIDGKEFILNKGETIVMPAGVPHSVYAREQFKMFLIVLFS
jgi:quercetin dioxygenase-like cupin family protein